ncbi:hypothetical protein SASPL_143713 [Salvia splendens]|uniref:Rhamnogalacturonan endolyase n=1 Tax=Salvia splendens TaxID=180675 RepID=A0A8X8ZB34_SALSN|nr:hypothetical protein SASPL_143713 [Salvia splendens]
MCDRSFSFQSRSNGEIGSSRGRAVDSRKERRRRLSFESKPFPALHGKLWGHRRAHAVSLGKAHVSASFCLPSLLRSLENLDPSPHPEFGGEQCVYNLYAWVPGVIGDFRHDGYVVINPGSKANLGDVVYTPPRNGPTLWEIGIPDCTAVEFYIPDPSLD